MKKILIVDDSQFMRNLLKDAISRKGDFEIMEADSGARAEKLFKENRPDLTVLDIIMPEGEEEGVRVLKEIMAADSKAKVIMVTAVGRESLIVECQKLGVKDYITKPFDDQKIAAMIEKYLA